MQTLQIDPEFQAIAPPLTPGELATLEASLLAEGCREPIDVWNGVIVDGHNRYALCRKHSIEFKVVERTFQSHDHAIVWIVQKQFGRRNITQAQRENMAIQHMKPALTRIGLEKKSAGGVEARSSDAGNNVSVESTETLLSGDKQAGPHVTDAVLAKASGTSESGIQRTNYIRKNAPETLLNKYLAGEVSRDRAYKLTNALLNLPEADRNRAAEVCIDHDEKARILARLHKSQATDPDTNGTYEEVLRTGGFHYGDEMEKWCDFKDASLDTINDALKSLAKHHAHEQRLARQEKRAALAQSLTQDVFNAVLADPPWEYSVQNVNGAANNHYDTMPLEDICALPEQLGIKFADNAVLFLWVTNPFLVKALEVVRAWGFEYKTNIVWVKTDLKRPGAGHYIRGRHELLYICTRGTMTPLVDVSPPIGSVIQAPLQEHSRKPDEVYSIIERLYPGCNYVELFAIRPRDGWKQYGDIEENEGMAA